MKVEGREGREEEEEAVPVGLAGTVRTRVNPCITHLDTQTESTMEDWTEEASSQMATGDTTIPGTSPDMLIPLGSEVREARLRTRRRNRVQRAMKQLCKSRFHVVDANSITLSMCDY